MKSFILFIFIGLTIQTSYAFDHQHQKLSTILTSHLIIKSQQSLFNYKKLKASPELLNTYLKELSAVSKKSYLAFTSDQKLSFLINAYNAFTLKLIIKNYPIKSIKDIGGFFSKPWGIEFFKLFGEKFTLDKIEHDTIRKNFKEARIHFAVNCASISCPSLYKEAFTADRLQAQLDEATKNFLTNKEKNIIDTNSKVLKISKIFDWYEKDFIKYEKSVKYFIAKSLQYDDSQTKTIVSGDVKIEYLDYDWSLNEWTP